MQDNRNKPTSSHLRSVGKLLKVVSIGLFLVGIMAVILIVIPVERDMRMRNQITARVLIGQSISDLLVSFRNEHGFWPQDSENYSQNGVEVLSDGLVRVYFEVPASIKGKWADLKVFIENGRYYRSCRAPDIKSGQLPAWCRESASVEELRLPSRKLQSSQ